MALGAEARDVVRLMMRQGVVLAGVGMTLGLGLALLATRGLSNFLFGVSPFDLGIFAGVTGMLLGPWWQPIHGFSSARGGVEAQAGVRATGADQE